MFIGLIFTFCDHGHFPSPRAGFNVFDPFKRVMAAAIRPEATGVGLFTQSSVY
jgi:hypothetical protein